MTMDRAQSQRVEQRLHFRRKPRPGRRVAIRYSIVDGTDGTARSEGRVANSTTAYTLNIGVGGAFVESEDPPPPGTRLVVDLIIPPDGRSIALSADVRWIADGEDDAAHGMGIRFHGLDEERLLVLNDYFASILPTVDHDEAP